MNRQQAVESLMVSLTSAIEKWTDSKIESDEWLALQAIIPDSIDRLMSRAAMSVLEAVSDVPQEGGGA